MKYIRTKKAVIVDAQSGRTGIVAVKMLDFRFMGNLAIVEIAYYEQVLNRDGSVGQVKYNYVPIPVNNSGANRMNLKKVTLQEEDLNGLFTSLNTSISKGNPFCLQLSALLDSATLVKMVMDQNYRSVSEDNTIAPLTMEDWEVVNAQELIES